MNPRPLNSNTGNTQDYRTLLVAKITALHEPTSGPLTGRKVYEWVEQSISAAGGDENTDQPRTGVYTSATDFENVLLDSNDTNLTIGSFVWARMKGVVTGNTVYETVAPSSSGGTPSSSTPGCSCSWLSDVQTSARMLLQLRGGLGRCSCVTTQSGTAGTKMVWDSGLTWKSQGLVALCCGCGGGATFTITNQATLTATLTLDDVYESCNDATPYTLALTQECCGVDELGRPYVQFWGKGADPCSGTQEPCDNTFHVRVVCTGGTCDDTNTTCDQCLEAEGPAFYVIDATGFSGDWAEYNRRWVLAGSGCTWTATCGDITVTMTPSCDTMTVTFSGAVGGTVTYEYTNAAGIFCFEGQTATRATGDTSNTPPTVTYSPQSCDEPCSTTLYVSSSGDLPCSNGCSAGVTWASELMDTEGPLKVKSLGGGGTSSPCDCNGAGRNTCKGFGVTVRCNSDGTFTVGPWCNLSAGCGTTAACYAGPAEPIVATNTGVGGAVLFTVTFTVTDAACDESPASVTLTFSDTP